MARLKLTCIAGAVAALTLGEAAVAASLPGVGDPRLNGFWVVDQAQPRPAQPPRAELTPAGEAVAAANRARAAERLAKGETVVLAAYTCGVIGMPFIMTTSEPWLLAVTDEEVTLIGERYLVTPRRMYTDGRTLPDMKSMPPSSSGYSIARWEAKELVVTTKGLPAGGLQGGGLKGPETTLTERVSADASGERLSWSLSWEDPQLMKTPLSYTLNYVRAPADTYALTQHCDPNSEPGKSVEAPPQEEGPAR